MTDHAMVDANGNMLPGAQINNGCTESGHFLIFLNTVR